MITRRDFLRQSLAVVSLGVGVPSVFGRALAAAAEDGSAAASKRTLIVVQLAGGIDGLNTVIPYKDPAYRTNRPTLGIAENELLPIDDRFAFHPGLAPLKGLLDAGKLAVVHGVGYPNPNFSHFRAMDIWQTADPDGKAHDGWLGRYFDGLVDAEGHPLAGLSIGRSLPTAFETANTPVPSVGGLDSFALAPSQTDPDPDRRRTSLMRLYDVYKPSSSPFGALLDTTLYMAYDSSLQLKAANDAYTPAVAYPESSLASGLQLLASLIHSGGTENPLRVGHVTLGGFDTHTQQPATLDALLRDAATSLTAFWQDVVAHGHGDDVLVMTWSEFGRRVPENAQNGTDHGSATPMFLIGNAVKPGLRGEPTSLSNLDNGNLRFTTDFRSVYATVLERWLEAPADDVLGAKFPQLDVIAA
ncbi:MAG TPA: DUF1501 domain-containing protein [Dehalococcoidia bacterium]|nr:DUF1501 domain-containing protein [Dehalococcoidia bacterium]